MFDLDGVLLSPDRRPTSLGEQVGSRGIVVVGVGKGGERGFQMAYRFNCIGKQSVKAGVNLVLIYPKASSRHVLDPLSVASSRFQGSPVLLLDGDGHFFRRPQQARSLSFAHMAATDRRSEHRSAGQRMGRFAADIPVRPPGIRRVSSNTD
ncbi:hypothetical protein [Paraburkholderia sediminicola]|uniref:hypothetical protein n=1 Tax=Paraburkholderia sediminicola TaxID=458836 RepID=UPI0038B93B65